MPAVARGGTQEIQLSTGHGCAGTTTITSSNQSTTNVIVGEYGFTLM